MTKRTKSGTWKGNLSFAFEFRPLATCLHPSMSPNMDVHDRSRCTPKPLADLLKTLGSEHSDIAHYWYLSLSALEWKRLVGLLKQLKRRGIIQRWRFVALPGITVSRSFTA